MPAERTRRPAEPQTPKGQGTGPVSEAEPAEGLDSSPTTGRVRACYPEELEAEVRRILKRENEKVAK